MKKNFLLLASLAIGMHLSFAQDEFFETWYKINQGDGPSRERITISPDSLVIERLQDYEVDTPFWQVDKVSLISEFQTIEDGIQIIGIDGSKAGYTGGELVYGNGNDQMLLFQLRDFVPAVDSVYKLLASSKYKELLANPFYTESKAKEIAAYPNLDAVSKEEMITLFDYLLSFELVVDTYLIENAELRYARMLAIRGLETLRDHKLIEMGFNPYRITESYYGDRFKEDPDLIEMNERSKYIKLF